MNINDFDYNLPKELIAQTPLENRAASKLLVMDKKTGELTHEVFKDITKYLHKGDVLVLNNTKVIPARLIGEKEDTKAHIELLLLNDLGNNKYECLARPQKRLHVGTIVSFGEGLLKAKVLEIKGEGIVHVEFIYNGIFYEILDKLGEMPLPPYIHEKLKDKTRYNTVYAKIEGSAAAPTAGLHFTEELLKKLEEKGVEIANVTLHVGIGTFRPVKVENIEEHDMHSEHFYIKQEDVDKINETKRQGKRVIAVGTTSCRVLETIASEENGMVEPIEGDTKIFIYPGYKFKCIDGLITNFHLPESTLLMLVSALAGKEYIMKAYNEAVKEKYKFFSFGDAMFIQ